MRKFSFIVILIGLLYSCNPWSSETNRALELAGDNRAELEKVLRYYHEIDPDPLKLKAAEYLISNMVYQYSQFGPGVDSLDESYQYVYGIYREDRNSAFLSDSLKQKRAAKIDAEYDLRRLSSQYLIGQIESAFDTYNRYEWCKWYPFEIFCEYILPYKIGHSDTVSWRSYAREKYGSLLDYSAFEAPDSYYEAEHFASADFLKVKVEGASGHYIHKLEKDGSITFEMDFHTKWKGYQLFNVHYLNGNTNAANVRIMVDNLVVGDFVFPATGSWEDVDKNVPPVDLTVMLDSGHHKLQMIALDKDVFLDFIYMPEYIYMKFPNSVIPEGRYYLTNTFGRVTVRGDSLVNETTINVHPNPSDDWPVNVIAKDGNLYQLVFEQESGLKKAIDAFPFGDSDWVLVYNDHGYANQQWAFVPMEDGGYQIRNKETGKILAYRESDSTLIQLPVELMRDDYVWHLEKVKDQSGEKKDSIDISVRAAQKISEITNRFHWSGSYIGIGPVNPIAVLDYAYGSCVEETNFQTMLLRSMGVACAVDFVFNYPERDAGHSWSVIFDLKGNTIQNNCHNPVGAGTWVDVFAKGKVYRRTNTINRKSLFLLNNGKEPIPEQFQNPYFKDVTREYCQVQDVEVSISPGDPAGNKYGYLMVFNNDRWVPTCWGEKTKNNTVQFKDVEPRGMYLPAFYVNGAFEALNEPFYFDSLGNTHHVKFSKNDVQELALKRKFPNRQVDESYHKLIIGGKFQGANRADFSDATTIGIITEGMVDPVFHEIDVDSNVAFRYLRYLGPDEGRCNINEVIFFDSKGDTVKGEIIGTEGSFENNKKTKDLVFDGDVLTYFDAPEPSGSWVGLKLTKPKAISKIRFVTRNDGNMVEIGDEYELVYWGGQDWVSMGAQTATCDSLIYKDVPKGGLYLLQNHTKGWEERIFTLDDDGKQVWW